MHVLLQNLEKIAGLASFDTSFFLSTSFHACNGGAYNNAQTE